MSSRAFLVSSRDRIGGTKGVVFVSSSVVLVSPSNRFVSFGGRCGVIWWLFLA